ncbi:MAG: T9SS type A sorting domain-containing protein [Chitinophagales bacterium]|nr:T9SS type A sorting domain-containing protein [Chitinophagales bacterium]
MSPCIPRYKLEYKRLTAGTWTVVDYATSPVVVHNNSSIGLNVFEWRVTAYCSPNNSSATPGSNFSIPHCTQTLYNCTTCLRLADDEIENYSNLLSVYPNPTDGSFKVLFQTPDQYNGSCIIEILDQAGKAISSSTLPIENGLLDKQMKINLASGFYWVKVIVDFKVFRTKLILQKE